MKKQRILILLVAALGVFCPSIGGAESPDDVTSGGVRETLIVGLAGIRNVITIVGEINRGNQFIHRFGPGFVFLLDPAPNGWTIMVKEEGREEDLARMTPPLHFVPNPRELDGVHFRDPSGEGGPRRHEHDNVPGREREFIFSPDVGRIISGPSASRQVTPEEIERIGHFGRGAVKILDYRLEDYDGGGQTRFVWMRFELRLSWPAKP